MGSAHVIHELDKDIATCTCAGMKVRPAKQEMATTSGKGNAARRIYIYMRTYIYIYIYVIFYFKKN